jgi:tRNA-dihydrouridine synthase
LLDYIELLLREGVDEADGFRHHAPTSAAVAGVTPAAAHESRAARGHERWVINKLRALCSWYSKGLEGGSQVRVRVNSAERIAELYEIVEEFFLAHPAKPSNTPESDWEAVPSGA